MRDTPTNGGRRFAGSGRRGRIPKFDAFGRDITLVLVLKLLAIFLLWFAFFQPADAPRPKMTPERVMDHLVAPESTPEASRALH